MIRLLINPFEKLNERLLLLIGIASIAFGSATGALMQFRFDGILDMHTPGEATIMQTFFDNLIDISCLVICLFIAARGINEKTRPIDLLNTSMVARLPLYLAPLFDFTHASTRLLKLTEAGDYENIMHEINALDIVSLIVFALFSIWFLVWYVALLYNGYKVACNAKSGKAVAYFILALLAAEIISKILISQLNY
ncbi:hypothetical protein GC194_02990 [bacterium]|nr:hypothetical protein [bacterium]